MSFPILGLHHVTATVDEAQADLDFAAGALGLRLVKKTVNFDNHHVYHFYYGNERGTPGTIWTTFPYHGRGVRVGTKGAGQIVAPSFSVPAGSLDFWHARLQRHGVTAAPPRFGEPLLTAVDPSGLAIELVATEGDARPPWTTDEIESDKAIRGLHSVSMVVRSAVKTLELMTGILGFTVVSEMPGRVRLSVNGGGPGRTIDVLVDAEAIDAVNGLGTVHHVAMAIGSGDQQLLLREELLRLGYQVTPVRDRQYFQSIYFREPGGVLFEVATTEPGFAVDESLPRLGRELKLPPWEEPNRREIEEGLARVTPPEHARVV